MSLHSLEEKKPKTIQGMNHRDWCTILQLIHKAQTKRDDTKRGRKRGGMDGMMDKIIHESVVWNNLDRLEESIREICFKVNSNDEIKRLTDQMEKES